MTKKLFQNQAAKVKIGFWWLSRAANLERLVFYLILLLSPTQFGRHFWPSFSYVYGIRIDYLSPTVYVTDILISLLFVLVLINKRKLKVARNFLLFIFYIFLVLLISNYWQVGIYGFVKILEFSFFVIYITAASIKKESLIKILVIPFLFESFLSIWQFLNKGSIGSLFYFLGERTFNGQTPGIANASIDGNLALRPYGTFSHPNVLAAYLLIVFTLIIFSFKKFNIFFFITLVIGGVALLLTFSRVVILLFGVIILFKLYLLIREKQNKLLHSAIGLIALSLFLYAIFLSPFSARFLSLSLSDLSVVQRQQLMLASFQMFLKSPLLGLGVNSFLLNIPHYINQQYVLFIQPVHNIYLLILSELGLFGISFFVLLLVKAFRKIIKTKNFLIGMVLVEILVLGFFDHYFLTLQQGQLLFALVIGLSLSKLKLGIE
jgi:O-antigen ligase